MRESGGRGRAVRALGYLAARSARNFARLHLSRLKEPRYAISAMAGLAYLAFVAAQAFLLRPRGSPPAVEVRPESDLVWAALAGAGAAFGWVWPGRRVPLRFSAAEIHWLFCGPFPRPLLVGWKIAARLPGTLLSALFLALWRSIAAPPAVARDTLLAAFLFLFTLDLHVKLARLVRVWAREHGVGERSFSLAALALLLAVAGVVLRTLGEAGDWRADPAGLGERLADSPAGILIAPLLALARPLGAAGSAGFAGAAALAAGVCAAHLLAVLLVPARIEEPAVESWWRADGGGRPAPDGAEDRGAGRPLPRPFRLRPTGPIEVALLWKNLIAAGRLLNSRVALAAVAALALAAALPDLLADYPGRLEASHRLAAGLAPLVAALVLFAGPSLLRNDLRLDLARLDVIKALPASGPRLVAGSALAPWLVLVLVTWWLLGFAATPPSGGPARSLLAAAAVVAPGLLAVAIAVQNAVAVLFPALAGIGPEAGRGMSAMGQGLLASLARSLVLAVAWLPAGVLGLGVVMGGRALGLRRTLLAGAAAALVVLAVEAALVLWLTGVRFGELEPGADGVRTG